jgi:hypothetical protein
MEILVPDPVVVTLPGVRVSVHVPVDGNPVNITLPVETVHVGWVTVPTMGALGLDAGAEITTLADGLDTHPAEVTVKVYVPGARPEIVVLVPVPVVITPSGVRVNVHVPVPGKPLSMTLPVEITHVG